MALKVELKPGEKLLVGQCIITNSDQRARLFIEGSAPILREKDILTLATADTPAKRIYLAVQLMYIEEDISNMQAQYFALITDFIAAAPLSLAIADRLNEEISGGNLYKALRIARELIDYENQLFDLIKT